MKNLMQNLIEETQEFAIDGFYKVLINKTEQAKKELKFIQKILEKNSNFVLDSNIGINTPAGKMGVMTYMYGMLVLIRNAETVVFRADTKAVCGFYKEDDIEDDRYVMVPFLGADKIKMGIEIDHILRDANIHVEVHDETDSFDGPWQWEMPKKQKLLIGVPSEIVNLSGKQRYATNVAKEFVPLIEQELRKEQQFEAILRNIDVNKMARA